jgi:CYTH domain-containing protein
VHLPWPPLGFPAELVTRQLALALLDRAVSTLATAPVDPAEREAFREQAAALLHHLRLAGGLRPRPASPRERRRLARMVGALAAERVARALADTVSARVEDAAARGHDLEWTLPHLEERQARLRRRADARFAWFEGNAGWLRRRLARLRVGPLTDSSSVPVLFGPFLAGWCATRVERIAHAAAAGASGDPRALRRTARAAGSLAALLEAHGRVDPAVAGVVLSLQELRNGVEAIEELDRNYRKLARLRRRAQTVAERRGLAGALSALRVEREARVAGWCSAWPTDRIRVLVAEMGEVGGWLQTAGGAALPVETERKFLLHALPPLPGDGVEVLEVEQGWIPGNRLAERLRRTRTSDGTRYHRAIKFGRGVTRVEIEEETTPDLFSELWPLTVGRRVRKTRFRVNDRTSVWEIDRFDDRDLVLAEIEIPSADGPVHLPPWLRPYLVREVTGESEWVNLNLAR